mmetsp:Transcript_11608/g.34194  ORF Transcript_11608/g.34194 Transcript_11608/m.34194 type:complete len:262 (+) Transcript_11608:559-1344(+)
MGLAAPWKKAGPAFSISPTSHGGTRAVFQTSRRRAPRPAAFPRNPRRPGPRPPTGARSRRTPSRRPATLDLRWAALPRPRTPTRTPTRRTRRTRRRCGSRDSRRRRGASSTARCSGMGIITARRRREMMFSMILGPPSPTPTPCGFTLEASLPERHLIARASRLELGPPRLGCTHILLSRDSRPRRWSMASRSRRRPRPIRAMLLLLLKVLLLLFPTIAPYPSTRVIVILELSCRNSEAWIGQRRRLGPKPKRIGLGLLRR